MSDTLVEPHDPRAQTKEYQSQLSSLEVALVSKPMPKNGFTESESEHDIITELYRTATLVYLRCGSASPGNRDQRLDALIDRGFHLIGKLKTCERSLPLLLIGSEARNDKERMVLLELIQRTEARHTDGNVVRMKVGIAMFWSQRDLGADDDEFNNVDYLHRMDTVFSSACTLPFFS